MLGQEAVAGITRNKDDQNLAYSKDVCALAVGVKGETPEGWAANASSVLFCRWPSGDMLGEWKM